MKNLFKIKYICIFITFFLPTNAAICFSTNSPTINITHYEFGKIVIDEHEYIKDIVIWPDGKITTGPEDMHFMALSDFDELFNSNVKKLVIGTGDEGKVTYDISRKIKKKLQEEGIELILMNTHELVNFLNETEDRDFLVFAHLNC